MTDAGFMTTESIAAASVHIDEPANHAHDYSALLTSIAASFDAATRDGSPIFCTDAAGLMDAYLDALPSHRRLHTCSCCRRFMKAYGGLAKIGSDGALTPIMWSAATEPLFYEPALRALGAAVRRAKVTGPFLAREMEWGQARTGDWTHMAVTPPQRMIFKGFAKTARQTMAAKREDYQNVRRAMGEFSAAALDEALRVLRSDALGRSERFIAPLQWLRDLVALTLASKQKANVVWRAVATAPEGYCHPRSAVTATLLEDIIAGLPFEEIKRRWEAKVHPAKYQRPQAAPSAGNIKAAEDLFEKMGLGRALERRFARIEDIKSFWTPKTPEAPASASSLFGHLAPKDSSAIKSVDLPTMSMSWEKFARTVLPAAERIRVHIPGGLCPFIALTAAAHEDAPPILKWDRPEERNHVAWYLYTNGSAAAQWMLQSGAWVDVTAFSTLPSCWGEQPMPFLGEGIVAILSGAVDTRGAGAGLFPEILKSELYPVRSTIEAYSRSAQLAGAAHASACGWFVQKAPAEKFGRISFRLKVASGGVETAYLIDRWD